MTMISLIVFGLLYAQKKHYEFLDHEKKKMDVKAHVAELDFKCAEFDKYRHEFDDYKKRVDTLTIRAGFKR